MAMIYKCFLCQGHISLYEGHTYGTVRKLAPNGQWVELHYHLSPSCTMLKVRHLKLVEGGKK